jgi:hypothetical protein
VKSKLRLLLPEKLGPAQIQGIGSERRELATRKFFSANPS